MSDVQEPRPSSAARTTGHFGKIVPVLVVVAVVAYVLISSRKAGPTAGGGATGAPPAAETSGAPVPASPTATGAARALPTLSTDGTGSPKRELADQGVRTPASVASAPESRGAATGAGDNTPASIKIGAWNIEWLGKPEDRAQFAKNVAQDPKVMAQYIVGSGVAVLGVAEIVTQMPGRPIRSREIEATIDAIRNTTGQRWEYALNPGRADGDQLTGFVWNTSVVTALNQADQKWDQLKDVAWRVPVRDARSSQGSRLWNRPPHAIKFRAGSGSSGKSDFVLIMLHMKADYNGDFAKHRQEEMDALIDALPTVRQKFTDDDIVLLGDTNVTKAGEAMIKDLEAAKYVDLNAANVTTTWRDGFTDRAFVPVGQPEFATKQFWVFNDEFLRSQRWKPGDFKRSLSDHYMVGTVLKVIDDDD